MQKEKTSYKNIDEYFAAFPLPVQEIMTAIRQIVHASVPDVEEKISWGMAAFSRHRAQINITLIYTPISPRGFTFLSINSDVTF